MQCHSQSASHDVIGSFTYDQSYSDYTELAFGASSSVNMLVSDDSFSADQKVRVWDISHHMCQLYGSLLLRLAWDTSPTVTTVTWLSEADWKLLTMPSPPVGALDTLDTSVSSSVKPPMMYAPSLG